MKNIIITIITLIILIIPKEIIIFNYCEQVGKQYDISPALIYSICESESTFNPNAENGSCKGLMQVSTYWHKDRMERLEVDDIFDPYDNILVGTDYLYELFQRYEDPGTVLMVYHGEANAVQKGNSGKYSYYAKHILERSQELEESLYGEGE